RLLPSLVLPEDVGAGRPRGLACAGLRVLAALPIARRPRAGTLAAGTLALVAAAAMASRVSRGVTGGRDAVRVIGRPALRVPGWSLARDHEARWSAEDVGLGDLYEPHRFPGGAIVGARLPLPPGSYVLEVEGTRFGAEPGVEVHPEPGLTPLSVG